MCVIEVTSVPRRTITGRLIEVNWVVGGLPTWQLDEIAFLLSLLERLPPSRLILAKSAGRPRCVRSGLQESRENAGENYTNTNRAHIQTLTHGIATIL